MKSISTRSIVELIAKDAFVFQEDWERPWNAQPISGRRYFIGNPRSQSACQYTIQWSPRKRELSIWQVPLRSTDPGSTRKVAPSAARLLTSLIAAKLSLQAPAAVEKTGCKCHCKCC